MNSVSQNLKKRVQKKHQDTNKNSKNNDKYGKSTALGN